ncbi:MAG: Mur ligase family protein, partial [Gammaproteobacteria bacterium]
MARKMMADRNPVPGVPLQQLLQGLAASLPDPDLQVRGLSLDSRAIAPGDAFLALKGYREDGGRYIREAVDRGAVAVLLEEGLSAPGGVGIPVIAVVDLREKAGIIAARFYGQPSEKLPVIGITGTNGKTSVCHYIAQALSGGGEKVGCIGTLGYGLYPALEPGPHTTPDAVTVQRLLAGFAAAAAGHAVMEVSSHALDQGRVNGVAFDIAVFTNLSHEHLDFHGDMAGYAAAKRKLFMAPGLGAAVINADDEFGRALLAELDGQLPTIGYATADEGTVAADTALIARLLSRGTGGQELEIQTP